MSTRFSVIIIGAGVSGLTLAQACQKKNIPFRIFERDSPASLSQHLSEGEGLTECWPLNVLKDALPDELFRRLSDCHANLGSVSFGEADHYDTFILNTAESERRTTMSKRVRLSQQKFRKLLLTGIEVQWSKTLTEISVADDSVKAKFSDGTSETGSILIGCDGGDSTVRRIMHPQGFPKQDAYELRHLLTTANYPTSEVSAIRNMHPFFLRCTHREIEVFLLITFFEETSQDSHADDTTKCQLLLQWPYRPNWLDRVDPTDCPNTKIGQRALLKHLSESWAEPFHSLIQNLPRDADIRPVELPWGVYAGYSPALGGRVALSGRAADPLYTRGGVGEHMESSSRDVERLLMWLEQMHGADGDFDWEGYEETLRKMVGV
ncbi:hypothetical protein Q7P36_002187 [Cladosporium allicinum]